MSAAAIRIEPAGENALIVYFAEQTSPAVSARIQQTAVHLEQFMGERLLDLVPSYASLLVIYDVMQCDHWWVRHCIRQCLSTHDDTASVAATGRTVELPVYYSPESGPDLEMLATNAGLRPEQVIDIHQAGEYRVYAIGFAPGFAYLGEVDERIAAPRLASPRLKVPRGAVAIADRQTAVYPAVSPGGWNLIGLCPTRMFNPDTTPTMPVSVGDTVRFKAIDRDAFLAMGGELP